MKKLFMLLFIVMLAFCAKYDVSIEITVSKEREESRRVFFETLKETAKSHNPATWLLDLNDFDDCNNSRVHDSVTCKALREKY